LFVGSDDAIQRTVLEAPWFKSCKRLCAYISCRALREVDTSKLLAEILQTSAKGWTSLHAQAYKVYEIRMQFYCARKLDHS